MDNPLRTILWLGWAFVCALGVRVGFTRLFRRRLGGLAQIAAYGMWFVCLFVGFVLVGWSGMRMYGFDPGDPRQVMGSWVLYFSPLGLPTAVGAPAVFAVDFVVAVITLRRRAAQAA